MDSSAIALLVSGAVVALIGAAFVLVVSARLRDEIRSLFRAFDRTERNHACGQEREGRTELRTDRDRLAERYQRLIDGGSESDSTRQ